MFYQLISFNILQIKVCMNLFLAGCGQQWGHLSAGHLGMHYISQCNSTLQAPPQAFSKDRLGICLDAPAAKAKFNGWRTLKVERIVSQPTCRLSAEIGKLSGAAEADCSLSSLCFEADVAITLKTYDLKGKEWLVIVEGLCQAMYEQLPRHAPQDSAEKESTNNAFKHVLPYRICCPGH